jgi:hypothetical protein
MTKRLRQIDANKWIEFDDSTDQAVVINRKELKVQLKQYQDRIKELPKINDAFKIAWFDQHYPEIGEIQEQLRLESEVERIKAILKDTGGE